MQFALGAMQMLTGGGAVAAGATGAAGAAGGSSIFGTILQGGLGLVSAMAAIRAGASEARMYRSEAADTRLNVTQEQIDAENRQTGLRKQLLASLGERDTAYAASGVDLSFGTPATARREAEDDANRALSQDQMTSTVRQSRLRTKAANLDAQAADAQSAGGMKAFGIFANTAFDIFKRG